MSKLDLNKALDFARLTSTAPTELIQAFIRDQSQWVLVEGAYQGGRKGARQVLFHVFKSRSDYEAGLPRAADTMGRRKARFSYPYVDGQTTDDLGRKGGAFEMEIVLHGPTYRVGMKRLLTELNDPIPGVLTHPIWGDVVCCAVDWTLEHTADQTQAVLMRVRFEEHAFETIEIGDMLVIKTPKNGLQKVLAAIQAIAAAIAAVRAIVSSVQSLVLSVRNKIEEIYSAYQTLTADAASCFGLNAPDTAAASQIQQGGNLAPAAGGRTAGGVAGVDPGSFGANPNTTQTSGIGGTQTAGGGFILVSQRFTTVVQPTDPFANIPINLLGDIARQAIEISQLKLSAETVRGMINEVVADIDAMLERMKTASTGGVAAIAAAAMTLNDARTTLFESAATMGEFLRAGEQNGRPVIIAYTLPRKMSLREVAFVNGLGAEDGNDLALLNPEIESVNDIDKGTVLNVPTFI